MKKDRGHVVDFEVEGIYAGVVAGVLLMACEMILAVDVGRSVLTPVIYAASVIMSDHAFHVRSAIVLPVGLAVHFSICALWGFVYGLVATEERIRTRRSRLLQPLLGAVAG
jgi:hypothetical protein